jgi:myo-inositol-1(or 4)-monophosphatase
MAEEPLENLLELAVRLAGRAAEVHRKERRTVLRVAEKTSPYDLVTDVDREAERAIVEELRAARPEDAILAEESGPVDGPSGIRWIVDPLDGTANYVYGYPAYAVAIGVEVDGVRTVGVVHDTARDVLYVGVRGRGATVDGAPIHAGTLREPATAMVATGFSFDPRLRRRQGEVVSRLLPVVRDVRRSGAASLDLCAVASGDVDLYYEGGLAPWDVSAGVVVAEAAGAAVLAGTAEGYPGTSVVAGNEGLLSRALPMLRDAGFVMAANHAARTE